MTEIDIDATQAAVRNILEDALAKLVAIGMTYENAASLLCIQGFCRVEDPKRIEDLQDFVNSFGGDDDVPPPPGEEDNGQFTSQAA